MEITDPEADRRAQEKRAREDEIKRLLERVAPQILGLRDAQARVPEALLRPALALVTAVADGWELLGKGRQGCPPRVPGQSSRDLDERQRIFELLKLEVDAAASLATRTTTLFALLAAGITVMVAFAGAVWIVPPDSASPPLRDWQLFTAKLTIVLAMVALVMSAGLGIRVIRPQNRWRQQVRELIALHLIGAWASFHSAVLLDATDIQRLENERQASSSRLACACAGFGLAAVLFHLGFVVCCLGGVPLDWVPSLFGSRPPWELPLREELAGTLSRCCG